MIKVGIVVGLEKLCWGLDNLPRYIDGHWYRHGGWGCTPLHLAALALQLDEHWNLGKV